MKASPEIIRRYNSPGLVVAEGVTANDLMVAGDISRELQRHYPGWNWGVDVNVRKGLIDIKCMDIDARFGYTIRVTGLYSWDSLRDKVKLAGGEILERYNMPRSRMDLDTWRSAPSDFTGLMKGDTSK